MFLDKLLNRPPFVRKPKPPSPYADYNTRMLASVLDVCCLMLLMQFFSPHLLMNPEIPAKIFTLFMMALLMAVMQHSMHTTPGKWLMGIKLVRNDEVTEAGFGRLCFRYMVCLISCGFFLLGVVWVMFDKKRRAWHDIAAGTVMLNTRPHGWYWQKIKQGWWWLRARFGVSAPASNDTTTKPPTE